MDQASTEMTIRSARSLTYFAMGHPFVVCPALVLNFALSILRAFPTPTPVLASMSARSFGSVCCKHQGEYSKGYRRALALIAFFTAANLGDFLVVLAFLDGTRSPRPQGPSVEVVPRDITASFAVKIPCRAFDDAIWKRFLLGHTLESHASSYVFVASSFF
ncbi:unnamed protein product [Sphagnum tenellum]